MSLEVVGISRSVFAVSLGFGGGSAGKKEGEKLGCRPGGKREGGSVGSWRECARVWARWDVSLSFDFV